MITNISIENFKSIGSISFSLKKFNCFIGMNGAGKSTLLQALDFISHLMIGDVGQWLDSRGWTAQDLNSKFRKESNIKIGVMVLLADNRYLVWSASFNRHDMRCSSEAFFCDDESERDDVSVPIFPRIENNIFRVASQTYRVREQQKKDISFNYEGSILSQLKDAEIPQCVIEFRDMLRNVRSLELLSPHLMRKRARINEKDIGSGGEKLAGFLSNIKGTARESLRDLLKTFYPSLVDFKVSSLRAGWKRLLIIEQFGDRRIETDATHLNDGLLRILAVLAQTESDRSMILLDEIENGINQEIVQKLVNVLLSCRQQIIVTTHSPLVLNYLPDQIAVESVKFIYKSLLGETRTRPFFEISRIKEKLEYMGAGDAFVDTDLMQLAGECNALDEADAAKAAAAAAAAVASQLPPNLKAASQSGSISLAKASASNTLSRVK